MIELLWAAAVTGLLLAIYAALRFWRQLLWMRPAPAHVLSHDYSAYEAEMDRDRARVSPRNVRLGSEWRGTTCRVQFEDETGTEQRADVTQLQRYGERPDTVLVIWYDPQDPSRATATGPARWFLLMVGGIVLTIGSIWLLA